MSVGGGGGTARSGEEIGRELTQLRHAIDCLELVFSARAAAFAATDEYEKWGCATSIDWIRIHCNMTGPAAADRVAVGEHLHSLPESVAAMENGEIGFGHLTVMSRTADALSRSGTAAVFNESALLDKARENSVGKFHHICRHARHAADPKGFATEQAEMVEDRRLTMSTWADGALVLSGVLDPIGGAAVRTALEPFARRSGVGDDRCRARRLADALVDLSMYAMDNGLVPQQASQRTHLQVTTCRRNSPRPRRFAGRGDGVLATDLSQNGRAAGMRLQCDADPAGLGLIGHRRRAGQASYRGAHTASAQHARRLLSLAEL